MLHSNAVVLDVDNVLLDCLGGFQRVASDIFGRDMPEVNKAYGLGARFGLTKPEEDMVWRAMEHHDFGWRGFALMPGALEAFTALKDMGHSIHLVTAIPEALRELREECLGFHGLLADSMHCAGHMHASKALIVQEINPVMMVEDRLSHLHSVPFVPYRVWIDHGDDQDGLVVDEDIIHVRSITQWTSAWKRCKPRPFFKE